MITGALMGLSLGEFLELEPRRAGVVSTDALSGFHGLHFRSISILGILVTGALGVTGSGKLLGKGAVLISTARIATETMHCSDGSCVVREIGALIHRLMGIRS